MIPFDELVMALERFRRRQAGQDVPATERREDPAQRRWREEPSAEINLDEVEAE
ncbi:MAG: hypothetical protein RMK29_15900 [Myxococcales bacterium]|nr:hypothetical protein [Myxococcota bacterium]MDW8283200.1 hypothetical protein [Myxococcales bacterium]